jgi:hypothetical protein
MIAGVNRVTQYQKLGYRIYSRDILILSLKITERQRQVASDLKYFRFESLS